MWVEMGRLLMVVGALLFVIGVVMMFAGRLPGIGNLPGDIAIERDNFRLYVPLGTMIVLSLVLTLVLNVVIRLFR